uniref:Uncharacterized protein n=1 Tax=Glossina austeni TaxID=7395 RepID=A0A1A9VRH7_GLOAU
MSGYASGGFSRGVEFTIVIADLSIDLFIVVFCLINLCTYVMADFELCMKKILKKSLGFVLAQGAASSPIIHIYRISNSIKSKRKKYILKISFLNNHKGIDAKEEMLPLDHRRPHRPLVVELAKDAWQDVADVPQQMPVQRLLRLCKEFLMRDEREDDGMETLMFLDRGQNEGQLDCQLRLQVQQLENMETVVVNEVQGLGDQAQVNDEDALDVVYVTWDEVKNEQQLQMLLDVQQPQVPSMDTAYLQQNVASFNINSTLSACLQHLNSHAFRNKNNWEEFISNEFENISFYCREK